MGLRVGDWGRGGTWYHVDKLQNKDNSVVKEQSGDQPGPLLHV